MKRDDDCDFDDGLPCHGPGIEETSTCCSFQNMFIMPDIGQHVFDGEAYLYQIIKPVVTLSFR